VKGEKIMINILALDRSKSIIIIKYIKQMGKYWQLQTDLAD